MKHSVKSLIGFTMGATDGEIGKVKEFYFDDETWTIRYLIVDTGNWLSGRVVLISTLALLVPDLKNKVFPVDLLREQIKNSPDINTESPVSRQEEIRLNHYYPWASYWEVGGHNVGSVPLVSNPIYTKESQMQPKVKDKDKHLRSTGRVTGYNIRTTDGEVGDVEDFLIDINTWKIEFMLIDTGNWFSGKKVLISPDRIKEIDWETGAVVIDTTMEQVKSSPEYDPKQEFTKVYTLSS